MAIKENLDELESRNRAAEARLRKVEYRKDVGEREIERLEPRIRKL